jgi:hypothetical protein
MSGRSIALLLAGVVWAFGVGQAAAALVLYEPFNYPLTSDVPASGLTGVDGTAIQTNANGAGGYVNSSNGQRWVPRAYAAGSNYAVANDAIIANADLTVPGLQKSGASNAASYGGLGYTSLLPLGQSFTPSPGGTSVYYSLAFRIDDLSSLAVDGGMVAAFTNVEPTGSIGNPSVNPAGLFIKADPGNAGRYFIGLGKTLAGATGANYTAASYAVGDTQFVVGRYTLFDGATTDDVAAMFVNPSPSTFGGAAPLLVDLQNGPGGNDTPAANNAVRGFTLRQSGAANGQNVANLIIADEIRVGTTYADVTPPVPEPSAAMLAGLAALGAGWRGIQRRPRSDSPRVNA